MNSYSGGQLFDKPVFPGNRRIDKSVRTSGIDSWKMWDRLRPSYVGKFRAIFDCLRESVDCSSEMWLTDLQNIIEGSLSLMLCACNGKTLPNIDGVKVEYLFKGRTFSVTKNERGSREQDLACMNLAEFQECFAEVAKDYRDEGSFKLDFGDFCPTRRSAL